MKILSKASAYSILTVLIVTFLAVEIDSIGNDMSSFTLSLFIASVTAIVAFVVILFWAIPFHLILKRYNYSNPIWYILLALIPSFIFIFVLKPFGQDLQIDLLKQALFCTFAGSLGAIVFWYITVYKIDK